MAIDVHELKARIAKVRTGAGIQPQAARAAPLARATRFEVAGRAGFFQRVYRIPVLGYAVRIATAVWNIPSIIANLQNYYTTHSNDVARFYTTIDELRLQVELAESVARAATERINKLQAAHEALQTDYSNLAKHMKVEPAAEAPGAASVPDVHKLLVEVSGHAPIVTYGEHLGDVGGVFVQVGGACDRTGGLNGHGVGARFVGWPNQDGAAADDVSVASEIGRSLTDLKADIGVMLLAEDLTGLSVEETARILGTLYHHLPTDSRLIVELSPGQFPDATNDLMFEYHLASAQSLAGLMTDAGFTVERAIRFSNNETAGPLSGPGYISLIARAPRLPAGEGAS